MAVQREVDHEDLSPDNIPRVKSVASPKVVALVEVWRAFMLLPWFDCFTFHGKCPVHLTVMSYFLSFIDPTFVCLK
jgi:hypothetical protein